MHSYIILENLNFVLFLGSARSVCKATLMEDTKIKFFNLNVNVVSHNKWWPVTIFLHSDVILKILSFVLFLGGVVLEVSVKWPQ